MKNVQVGDHDVTGRSGQLDDLSRPAVDLARLTDQRPAAVR